MQTNILLCIGNAMKLKKINFNFELYAIGSFQVLVNAFFFFNFSHTKLTLKKFQDSKFGNVKSEAKKNDASA